MKTHINEIDAIILAGGMGTRLRKVIADKQKIIAKANGRPFVYYLLDWLASYSIRSVTLALGYNAHQVVDCVSNYVNKLGYAIPINYAIEPVPLGTGGSIRFALTHTHSNCVLVMNGDSFSPFNLNKMVTLYQSSGTPAVIAVKAVDDISRFGSVRINKDNKITHFEEKSSVNKKMKSGFISTGIYILNREFINKIPMLENVSLERSVFPSCLDIGLLAYLENSPFIDIGTPDSYLEVNRFLRNIQASTFIRERV